MKAQAQEKKLKTRRAVNHWAAKSFLADGHSGHAVQFQRALLKLIGEYPESISIGSVKAALASTLEILERDPDVLRGNF